jgi:hypothetical protein
MKPKTRSLTDKDLNRFERGVLKNIQKHGWHANGIAGEGSSPAWTYSVGLFAKYGQPELIVFGLEIAISLPSEAESCLPIMHHGDG